MQEQIARSLAAFASGAVGIPLLLFVVFRAMFPVQATGNGNVAFWAIVVFGATLAATAVWFKHVPLWLAALVGPLTVLALLFPWLLWKVVNAA